MPDYDEQFTITPVAYFARATVHISVSGDSIGGRYNIANRSGAELPAIYGWLASYGYRLDVLPYHAWHDKLVREVDPASPGCSVLPLAPEHPALPGNRHPRIDCRTTFAATAGTGIDVQPLDEGLMHLGLDYMNKVGFLPPPGNGDRPAAMAAAGAVKRN